MLPYQAVAMDYGVSPATFQRHHGHHQVGGPGGVGVGVGVNVAGLNMNHLNPAAAAFTHSWFVPADLCGLTASATANAFKQNQITSGSVPVLEPGILELRKEKSRDAARSRRGKENYEFYELAKMLPLPAAITSQLDKASIIRLTISYLKLRDFSGHGDPPWSRDGPTPTKSKGVQSRARTAAGLAMDLFEQHQGTHILQSLDGFALALAADGRFLYISETVSIYLGLSQVEMTGSSIFDYVHHQDHAEIAEQLGLGLAQGQNLASPSSAGSEEGTSNTGTNNPDVSTLMTLGGNSPYRGLDRAFCIRMKSTLTKRGCHFKSSGYRVVLMLCRLRPQYTFSHSRKSQPPLLGMIALAIALPPPSVHEIRLESDMFVTRINFDFRIAHCEPRVSELLDYTAEELTGKNLYTLCHGEDANKLRKCHVDLINKGQVLTHYYRMMNKNGGYTWVQTCATVVCNSKNADEQNIICVNYIISGREYENLIMDCCQLEDTAQGVKREETSGNDPENGSPDADRGEGRNSGGPPNQHQDPHRSPPDLDDGSNEGPNDPHGRGHHIDHVTQLQTQPTPAVERLAAVKNLTTENKEQSFTRRPHKRKLAQVEESSCSDEDDAEESVNQNQQIVHTRNAVVSPASSSCHSGHVPLPDPSSGSPKTAVSVHDTRTDAESSTTGTSVKDLEHAMSKHLPSSIVNKSGGSKASASSTSGATHQPTDFSTDALLKQQQQRSTIQWIGAHHHLNHLNHHQQLQHAHAQAAASGATAPLPASALLRQLYANRESVIRANVHGITSASSSSRAGGNGSSSYFASDVNQLGPLPTPPGSEGSSTYGEHQFMVSQHQKTSNASTDAFSNLVSSYSAAGTGYSMDYHSAMTPPSSVSPRDKHQQLHGGVPFESPVYSDVLRHQYLGGSGVGGMGDSPAQPLPLKPQVYSAMHPSALDAAAAAAYAATAAGASTPLEQSQFYHHSAAAAAGAGVGFHLYHPTNKSTGASSTPNWYSSS